MKARIVSFKIVNCILLIFIHLSFIQSDRIRKLSVHDSNTTVSRLHLEDNAEAMKIKIGPHTITQLDDPFEEDIQVFANVTNLSKVGKQIQFENDERNKKYRKRYGSSGGGGYAYSNGVSYGNGGGIIFATAGGRGYADDNNKGGGESYGAYGGNKGKKSHHYNPSVNKYGGGGPLTNKGGYQPNNKGNVPNYGSSYVPERGGSSGNRGVDIVEQSIRIVICEVSDKCRAFTHCASHSYDYLRSRDRCCINLKQNKGMCCDANYPEASNSVGVHFNPYSTDKFPTPEISQKSVETAALKGYEYQSTYRSIENRLLELNIVVEKGTAAYGHLLFFQTTPAALHLARDNFLVIKATNYIQDTYFLTSDEAGIGLQGYDFGGTVFEKTCPATPKCDRFSKYRTADGSCNNPISPKLGQSFTPLIRLLPPDYADGVWSPRVRTDETPLPSARFITINLVPDANLPDPRYSHYVMQFGQFVDHDLGHVPIFRFGDFSGIHCCSNIESDVTHPACFPIEIPQNDINLRGQRCMNFVRSMIAPRLDCTFGHADQLNQLTHWLDASQIYGSTFQQAESLREFSGGRLKITKDFIGRDLLPESGNDCAQSSSRHSGGRSGEGQCFLAGDKRVNEQIGLTTIHTIFLREHNRVASELTDINPHWDDEILYQETRRIVTAEYQHILYNEWLPIIVGRKYMETFGILPLYEGYYDGYDSNVDGSVSNAFTTAAFRMGHTLVQGALNLHGNGGGNVGRLVLRDFFNNPNLLRQPGVIDSINNGLLIQPIQRFDNFVTTELRDHLFETSNSPGMDLIALNIQRGRDHGLPSYNEYRDLCRLGKARDFSDLAPVIHSRKIAQLERIYGNVDDIDLYIGGIHETPLTGALVGPTFACIIGDQFVRSKKGDFYFHDIGGQPHSFTKDQLQEIRRASLSRIICDNSDEIRSIQPLAFHLPNDGYNPKLPCGSPAISRVDLRSWKE